MADTKPNEVFDRIDASELAVLLHASAMDSSVQRPIIIDVRDAGTTGGYIVGRVNLPKAEYFDNDESVDELVKKYANEEVLVFHCLNSGNRGPTCATKFIERMNIVLKDEEQKPQVKILTKGFKVFAELYGNDPVLCEDMDS